MQKAMKEKALDRDSRDAGHAAAVARDTGEPTAASAAPNGSSYANGEAVSKTPTTGLLQVSIDFSSPGRFRIED